MASMEREEALARAGRLLDTEIRPHTPHEVVVVSCKEHRDHWIVGFNTRAWVEDGDLEALIVGYGPVIVPASGGEPWFALSESPAEQQLDGLT